MARGRRIQNRTFSPGDKVADCDAQTSLSVPEKKLEQPEAPEAPVELPEAPKPQPSQPEGCCPTKADPKFPAALAELLQRWIVMHGADGKVSSFDSPVPVNVSVSDYVNTLCSQMRCSPETYVFALVYIDRLIQRSSSFVVSKRNVHRLLLTAVVLAAKFQDDFYCNNKHYSMVGGISLLELNLLERRMLKLVGYRLQVTPVEYELYHTTVLRACAGAARS